LKTPVQSITTSTPSSGRSDRSRVPMKGRRVPSMVTLLRVMGELRVPAAMHRVEFQQMRVHRRIAHGIVDPGDPRAPLQQRLQRQLADPAQPVEAHRRSCGASIIVMRPMSSTAFCKRHPVERVERQGHEGLDAVAQRAVGLLEGQRALGIRAFGLHRVGQAPMPADGLSRPGRAFLVRGAVADGEDEVELRRVGPWNSATFLDRSRRRRGPCP
jgi:hypothetical protein